MIISKALTVVGSIIQSYIGENVSFLGKVLSIKGFTYIFKTGSGDLKAVVKNAQMKSELEIGQFYQVYGYVNGCGNVMVRYVSYQSHNVSGDESLDLRAKAVLLVDQHPSLFYGDFSGADDLTESEQKIMQE